MPVLIETHDMLMSRGPPAPHLPAGDGHGPGSLSECAVGLVSALPGGLSSPILQGLATPPRAWALKTLRDEKGLSQS